MAALVDLPMEILQHIFLFLNVVEFLSLTGTSKRFFFYHEDPTFWRTLTQSTFRIPPQPLLQADGARWRWLYKNLFTRTQLYTWGDNKYNTLGRRIPHSSFDPWPSRVDFDDAEVGVIADVQCGGWSTTLLNSQGAIFILGGFPRRYASSMKIRNKLEFPPPIPSPTAVQLEPAIKQFSQGRVFSLGLDDHGVVWWWETYNLTYRVAVTNIDLNQHTVTRVVAGWARGSIFVDEVGIVFWEHTALVSSGRDRSPTTVLADAMVIPGTGYRRSRNDRMDGEGSADLGRRIGMVTKHLVLEGHIVFTTDLGKVFSYRTNSDSIEDPRAGPYELALVHPKLRSPVESRDIQGSYRNFAIFTKCGSVLTASSVMLDELHLESRPDIPDTNASFTLLPQSRSIISVAFGDHHFHALHKNGTVTSYGHEPGPSGAFGLGGDWGKLLRGVNGRNSTLSACEARTVWFEPLMATWLYDTYLKGASPQPSQSFRMLEEGQPEAREAYGDYFEREGAQWEEEALGGEGELGPYFVLTVSAAGWHSAALVLVDEEKARQMRRKQVIQPSQEGQGSSPQHPLGTELSADSWTSWVITLLLTFTRWFLGLTARDLAGGGGGHASGRPAPTTTGHQGQVPATAATTTTTTRENPPEPEWAQELPPPTEVALDLEREWGLDTNAQTDQFEYKWTKEPFPQLLLGNDEEGEAGAEAGAGAGIESST